MSVYHLYDLGTHRAPFMARALVHALFSIQVFTYSTRVGLATHLRCTKLENIGAHLSMSAGYGAYAWDERPIQSLPYPV